jgi:putative transposase
MPRPLRTVIPGGIYHVMNRGNRRDVIFCSEGGLILFRELLQQIARARKWTIHAYCLMPNHYHVLLECPQADLSAGVQKLNGEYASWFNRCHGLVGHVFQGRFRSVPIESDGHFLQTIRYMALNPVRAGLCRAPADWRWSSYWETVAGELPTAHTKLLQLFGAEPVRAISLLRGFVEEEDRKGVSGPARPGSDPGLAYSGMAALGF